MTLVDKTGEICYCLLTILLREIRLRKKVRHTQYDYHTSYKNFKLRSFSRQILSVLDRKFACDRKTVLFSSFRLSNVASLIILPSATNEVCQ